MNIIIANNQRDKFNDLNIEVIKRMDGQFDVEEIISSFQNIFYNKMIIDITALKNYEDINTVQKLSISLDMDKIILLLEENAEMTSPSYLSKLISIGIYNFTTTVEGLAYLYSNPNTYRDVAHYHKIEEPQISTKINEQPVTPVMPIANEQRRRIILGIKSVTKEAGSTTLTYMIKKTLERDYDVLAIQVDKTDFAYFNDSELVSANSNNISDILNSSSNKEIIVIDLGENSVASGLCTDIIYLIEPSTIKLNKLMALKPNILKELKGRKIVLTKSPLNDKDIKDFSYESNLDVFFNLPLLDERKRNEEIISLLQKLNMI